MKKKKVIRKFSIEEHREYVVATLAGLKESSRSTKEDITDIKILLREQNNRVRKNERSIARIFGIGSAVATVFTGVIAWLFNK